MLVMGG